MLSQDQLASAADRLLKKCGGADAEVLITGKQGGATRFSNNAITQNIDEATTEIRLRVVKDGRQGIATDNRLDDASLDRLARRALNAASQSDPDPSLLPLNDSKPAVTPVPGAWDEAVANASPIDRAKAVVRQVEMAKKHGLEAAGLLNTSAGFCFHANSRGLRLHHRSTTASSTFSAFADNGTVEGAGDGMSKNLAGLDTDAVAAGAVERCLRGRGERVTVAPGTYAVVLSPEALSDLMLFMTWLGFSTQRISEGRAALNGKFGTPVFSPSFSMHSDPYHPLQQGRPFDMEGFATRPLRLIEKGVPTDMAHDRRTAKQLGASNTGHGNLQPDSYGPVPGNIVVGAGNSSLDEMIAGTERGLYVAQFHYTNTVDPMAMTVTGMTRAGLWQIENGKLGRPCNNLRFTESLIRAFSGVEAIGKQPVLKSGGLFGGGMVLPPVKLKAFTFSSGTEF